jgi:hypothetical protein
VFENSRIFPVALMSLGLLALPLRAAEFWVSPNGDDRNPGTKESPLATVPLAQRKARELRRLAGQNAPAGGTRIILRGGVYRLTSPLLFRVDDSGRENSPAVVEAVPGERPVLSGGAVVENWRRPQEEISGLPAAAKGKVWVADAPSVGGRPLPCRQLWVDDRKAVRARSPNGDTMERLLAWDRQKQEAGVSSALVATVANPAAVEMVVEQQWEIAILRVKALRAAGAETRVSFHEPESRIEFEHPWPQPILPPKGGGAFFLVGAVEFLDQPGEWCQETPGGRLICWPRAGEDLARQTVVVPALETLVAVAGSLDQPVAHLEFRGIGFEHAAWRRPGEAGHVPLQAGMHLLDAYKISPPGTPDKRGLENQAWIGRLPAGVTVSGAHHVTFERCQFEHMAAAGLDFSGGTHDDVVEGCLFRDIGGNGIQLGKFSDEGVETHVPYAPTDEREICTRERIANNLVTDGANEDWGSVGICVGYGREVVIEHNEVSHVSYTGISVGWGWTPTKNAMRDNRVYANFIHHIATRLCDTAGVYTLSAQPGTVVSENCVDAITMSPFVDLPDHWFYLYTDEGSSFITVRDNWCPAEKFLKNANGPGNVWERNGPMVPAAIKAAAGLEPAFRDLTGQPRN